jgi:hypothetical protein
VIHAWHVRGWTVELLVINGLLFGFSLPDERDRARDYRVYGLNAGPLCLCWWRKNA